MNRREFLKRALAGAAALVALPKLPINSRTLEPGSFVGIANEDMVSWHGEYLVEEAWDQYAKSTPLADIIAADREAGLLPLGTPPLASILAAGTVVDRCPYALEGEFRPTVVRLGDDDGDEQRADDPPGDTGSLGDRDAQPGL